MLYKKIKEYLSIKKTNIKCYYLGSPLSIKIQVKWEIFIFHMKIIYKKQKLAEITNNSIEFKKNRFTILGQINLNNIKFHIENKFSTLPESKLKILPRTRDPIIENFIYESLMKYSNQIESIYKSYFQTYWISIYKTLPGENDEETSFSWHQDADPRHLLKIFIYLNDTYQSNGAFITFDRINSKKLFKKSFISTTRDYRKKSQKIVENYLNKSEINIIEGNAGLMFIFDNNLIHRGTYPTSGYRTVVSIEIYPSDSPLKLKNIQKSLSMDIINDYPENPYRNRYN